MLLHPLAPNVEGLVARFPVRLPKRLARLAVGIAHAVDEVAKLDSGGGFGSEESLRLPEAQQRLPPAVRARAATEAVTVRHKLGQPLRRTNRQGVEAALELAQGLAHHVQIAHSGQQLADARQTFRLPPVNALLEPRADQPEQSAHALQASPRVMNRSGNVVLAGKLRLGDLDLF